MAAGNLPAIAIDANVIAFLCERNFRMGLSTVRKVVAIMAERSLAHFAEVNESASVRCHMLLQQE